MMDEQSNRTPKRRDNNHQMRQSSGNQPKRPHLSKYDVSQLMPPLSRADSSVNQVLNEANKIVQLSVQKEILLYDQEKVIKDSNDTIDNLRKNLIQMQMEYERLDQNYQREISYRSELAKRIETTRGMVESAGKYSNILAESVQLVTNDRDTIVEYYNGILKKQAEVEEKHKQVETMLRDQEQIIQKLNKCGNESSQKELLEARQTIAQLTNKLKLEVEEHQHLAAEFDKIKLSHESLNAQLNKAKASNQKEQHSKFLKIKAAFKNLQSKKMLKEKQWKNYKANLKGQIKGYQEKIVKVENLLKEAINQNGDLKNQHIDSEKKLEILQNEKAELLKQIEESEKLLETRQKEQQTLQEKINSLTTDFETLKVYTSKDYADLEEKYQTLVREKEELELSNNNFKLEKDIEIEKLNEKICELDRNCNIFGEKEKQLKKEIFLMEENINEERSKNLEASLAYEKSIEDMKFKIDELTKKENNLETLLKEKCEELVKTKKELSNREIVLVELKEELQSADDTKKSVDKLNLVIKNYQENICAYKTDLELLQKEMQEMKIKLEIEVAKNKSLGLEKSKFENTSITLKEELENERQTCEKVKEDLANIKFELYEAKKTIEDGGKKNEIVAHLKKSLEQSQADAEALRRIVKKLETDKQKEINDLKMELKELKNSKEKREESLETEIESIRKDLRSQLEKKKAEIENLQNENEKLSQKIALFKSSENVPEEDPDFSRPIIPERRTTAMTFSSSSTVKKFLTQPRKLFSTPATKENPVSGKKKDVFDFDSDSSVERYEPAAIRKNYKQLQKKETCVKGKRNMSKLN